MGIVEKWEKIINNGIGWAREIDGLTASQSWKMDETFIWIEWW